MATWEDHVQDPRGAARRDWEAGEARLDDARVFELDTPHGPARVHLCTVREPVAALILGHGAGGGVSAPDLVAAGDAARAGGLAVAFVEQPYRVAERRTSPPARQLDEAWIAVVERLRARELNGLRLVAGGRSAGARVACRTASACGAVAVLCLAFPLEAPRRSPEAQLKSRIQELEGVDVPTLVVQGASDPFGMPPPGPNRKVVIVAGNHSLRSDRAAVGKAIREWLADLLG